MGLCRFQQPVEKGLMFSGAALAVEILAQMPVRRVKDAHKSSMTIKQWWGL